MTVRWPSPMATKEGDRYRDCLCRLPEQGGQRAAFCITEWYLGGFLPQVDYVVSNGAVSGAGLPLALLPQAEIRIITTFSVSVPEFARR